jgi:translocation and assembly module TamB
VKLLARLRSHWAVRVSGRTISLVIAMLAAAFVASLTIDLGPSVRELGERRFSQQIKRPVHIGRLSIHLLRGQVVVEDFSIEGLKPSDRTFFTAKRLLLSLDWLTAFKRRPEFTIGSVELTDWRMLVEKWDDRNNFPKFINDDNQPPGSRRFTVTLKYLRASRGQFTFEDHQIPWSVVAPNIDLNITNLPSYHGTAVFNGGIVQIQNDLPMWTNMKARFALDGPRVHLARIDLTTDGAETVASGDLDFAHWPEQTYRVKSTVHFPRMREIFFKDERWALAGDGDFNGTFRLYKGGHDLAGTFASQTAGVNGYRFPGLYGSLRWTPKAFDVWNAGSAFYGGAARFTYSLKPLGEPAPPTARFDATVANTDLAAYTDVEALPGLRFGGEATGHILIEWPLRRFADRTGNGNLVVAPPPGVVLMTASVADVSTGRAADHRREWGPFAPAPLAAHLPIGGELTFRFDSTRVEVEAGQFRTEGTHATFQGSTDWGAQSRFAFHVTSRDWQESDEVLAGILTDFGSRTNPVPFGGRGEFDGVMTGPFRRPRVEGDFSGSDLWAWDTLWGGGTAHIAVENSYVNVRDGVVRLGDSEIHADGLFSTGYPRDDGGQEIDARFRVVRRDLIGLRHAFQIDEYPVSGLLSGEFHLTGQYQRPTGFGGMTIDNGVAYGEPLQKATASLRFDGLGIRLDGISIEKGGGGGITGAAFIGWDSTYSFNADGRQIPVERLVMLRFPRAPLSGLAEFTAQGSGTFEAPRNDFKLRVNDLFVGEEGVGQVSGSLALRGKELSGDIDAASPRLALTGTGRIALTPQADAELTFRFHDSSLDPYVRLFEPRLSPFTTAVASGSIRVVGELADFDHLLVDATVDTLDLRLFDYALKNAAPIRIALDQREVNVQDLQVIGEDTRLRLSGRVGLRDQRIALAAVGDANLGILQGFFRDVRGSGRAELTASMDGPLHEPVFSGSATITNGRVRHLSLPNALDGINGIIRFDARGVRLDDLSARMGEGPVQFGGRIGFEGYMPGELNVIVRGQDMHLRYPEGIRSIVDADLSVRGNFRAPTIGGTVTVKNAVWTRRIDTPGNIFDLVAQSSSSSSPGSVGAAAPPPAVPLRFDVRIVVPSTLRVDTNLVRLVASADLTLRGTYDRPVIYGRADIQRGEVNFEGRRYRVTRGSIDFTNPDRIEPFFDVEAETNVRVTGGQTYRVTVSAAGTTERLSPKIESDPPLPTADVFALLLSDVQRNPTTDMAPELRALQNPNQTQSDILKARATQALTSPLSSEVGKVLQQTIGVDTFQLSPSFVDPNGTRLSPTARLTIGKRISDRAYLTFSRSLNTTFNDQIIQLEVDTTDRLYWLLSRNEDQQTYAIEFRVRHAF